VHVVRRELIAHGYGRGHFAVVVRDGHRRRVEHTPDGTHGFEGGFGVRRGARTPAALAPRSTRMR
jgi:hypothetical protein